MPWFPDFANAAELARMQTRAAGHADPVGRFFAALNSGDTHTLETVWPGEVVVYDPRAGEIRGRKRLRQFVGHNQSWLAQRGARISTIASTRAAGRAVVELLAELAGPEGEELSWPVAVVAESSDDRSVVFRTYCSQWPVDGSRHVRPAILAHTAADPGGVVGRYHVALEAGDTEAVVATFASDGSFTGPTGPRHTHRGTGELRSFFARCFSAGGGIALRSCAVTDDGARCAVEYNCVRWGSHDLPPQAGIAVHERGADGLLAAVRVYDDVAPPCEAALRRVNERFHRSRARRCHAVLDGRGVGGRAVARRSAAGPQLAHPADPRPALLVPHDLAHNSSEQVAQCESLGRGQPGQQ